MSHLFMKTARGSKTKKTKSPKQLRMLGPQPRFFGGRLLYKKRRSRRPLSSQESIHFVMRSLWAKGEFSFRTGRNRPAIERIFKTVSQRYGVRVYRRTIMSNHIHAVMRVANRECYKAFIRVLTGQIASLVMRGMSFAEFHHHFLKSIRASSGLTEGSSSPSKRNHSLPGSNEPQGLGQKFFQFRPFTRVLHWGRDFKTCCAYVLRNDLEAMGFVPYQPRKDRYAKWIRETVDDFSIMRS